MGYSNCYKLKIIKILIALDECSISIGRVKWVDMSREGGGGGGGGGYG